tara:strand:- start:2625 stop:4094 length:1470 start_codon:yes stop_codon:yes gene_type:complete
MEWYEALILGIIQGLTEFLPISSSGHLEIASFLLKTNPSNNLFFTVLVHIATAISIIYVFKKDIYNILSGLIKFKKNEIEFASKIIVSSMPVGIIGLMYEKKIETLFTGNMTLVGSMLIVTSLLLFFTFFSKKDSDRSVSFKDAFIIGLAQALAIIPGISRSGATISTAILLKVNREEATRFSFIMVLVPIFGILLLKIYHGIINSELIVLKDNTIPYIIGFLSALISGIFACRLMLKIVRESKLIYFSFYCLAIGIIGILSGCYDKKNELFTITPVQEISKIREIALSASPPSLDSTESHLYLVEVSELDKTIKLDIRYASTNNFMQSKFYKNARAFLNEDAAKNLIRANEELMKNGFGLIIYDGYRPWFITKMFWEGTPNDLKHFVADPEMGSVHNRGCAIDIGLYNIANEKPVNMISGYDEFTEKAYPNYTGGTKKQREIRDLLISVMKKNNFSVYEYEWWHFNYEKCNSGIMNFSFDELDSINSI